MLYCPKEEEKVVKVIFLDIDGVLAHTDYLNWQTRHIDPEKVLEQIPSVISLDQLDIHCKHGTGRVAEVHGQLLSLDSVRMRSTFVWLPMRNPLSEN